MKKMSRRNYLMGMGATAGALVAGQFDVFGQKPNDGQMLPRSTSEDRRPETSPTQKRKNRKQFDGWPTTTAEPTEKAAVTLILTGLMGFFYDKSANECNIHFNSGSGEHVAELEIWQRFDPAGNQCSKLFAMTLPCDLKEMDFGLGGQTTISKVEFFEHDPQTPLDRDQPNYPKDFRWLIDLNGPDFYPDIDANMSKFNRRLKVRHGTFYTRLLSNSTFWKVDGKEKLSQQTSKPSMGYMPLIMASEVSLESTQFVSLSLGPFGQFNFYPNPTGVYEIQFHNHCETCTFEPADDDEEEVRNDFHYMRKVLEIPGKDPKYTIALRNKGKQVNQDICPVGPLQPHRFSDEAPCMGTGYCRPNC